jgi:hypothetical protein
MSISNPFRGHLRTTDPRNPLWGAGGSVFPTTPAYRYRLGSEHATGHWVLLRAAGVLFTLHGEMTHDFGEYRHSEGVIPPFQWMRLTRWFIPTYDRVHWTLSYKLCEAVEIWYTYWIRAREKTNVNMEFEWSTPLPPIPGSPGISTLYQVEHDGRLPPGGWPPWAT